MSHSPLLHLLHVDNEVGWGLLNLEDVQAPPDVAFIELKMGQLSPHVGDELHGLSNGDAVREGTIAVKLVHQVRHCLLEVLSRMEQTSLELFLHTQNYADIRNFAHKK